MKVFVINLDRRADRMAKVKEVLDSLALPYERISAFDAQSRDLRPRVAWLKAFVYSGFRPPLRGIIGAFLSHQAVWRQIVDRQISQALVVEDDVILANYDRKFLDLNIADLNLDLLRLEEVSIPGTNLAWISKDKPLAILDRRCEFRRSYGAAAYIVTLQGAKRLVSEEKYWFEIDHFEMWSSGKGLRTAILVPNLFRQADGVSDIAESDRAGVSAVVAPNLGHYATEGWEELGPLSRKIIGMISRLPQKFRATLSFYCRMWWNRFGW